MTRRQGRRRKKLLHDLKDRRGYCHLKEEALDRTMCGGIVLEEALDLSSDRILNNNVARQAVAHLVDALCCKPEDLSFVSRILTALRSWNRLSL